MTNPKRPQPSQRTPKAPLPPSSSSTDRLQVVQCQESLSTCQASLDMADALLARVRDDGAFGELDSTLQSDISDYLS